MKTILVAIHGILANQTEASWPDKLDAWMFVRDPGVKVLKKEYRAGPFPRWNCYVKDPRLALSLANELELFLRPHSRIPSFHPATFPPPSLWFVAHSNGAVIALLTAKILIERGHRITGLILTGAACEADIYKNQIFEWYCEQRLDAAIAYCSQDDRLLSGDADYQSALANRPSLFTRLRQLLWRKLIYPYGCLGRSGWLCGGRPMGDPSLDNPTSPSLQSVFTRWYSGGHSTYFTARNIHRTFLQICRDMFRVEFQRASSSQPAPGPAPRCAEHAL